LRKNDWRLMGKEQKRLAWACFDSYAAGMNILDFMGIKGKAKGLAFALAAGLSLASMSWAQVPEAEKAMPLDGLERDAQVLPDARRVAAEAIGQALRLADLLDIARLDKPSAGLDVALRDARELLPKPYIGMGQWESTSSGAIVAPVGSAKLCAELAKQCQSRPSEPGRCWCGNRSSGLVFAFDLPRLSP
jgi:hypothetical protein